jgi:radical SAM superfamily enzyme YgiQ (UPF0313 family)
LKAESDKIDILLIPPISIHPNICSNEIIPIGILTLMAILRDNHFIGKVFNYHHNLNEVKKDILVSNILIQRPGSIGFCTWCQNFPSVMLIAEAIKEMKPEIPIVLGGPHASVVGKDIMETFPFIDYVLVGEADLSLVKFLQVISSETPHKLTQVPGLYFRDKAGAIKYNSRLATEKNLDNLPIPAYNELNLNSGIRIDAGRGCPFRCTYCSTNLFFRRKYRTKSPRRIIDEMDYCYHNFGKKSFGFAHDMLVLNKEFTEKLCNNLIVHRKKKGIKYKWTCSARTDCINKDQLSVMANSGCSAIFYGVESGSPKIQKLIKKNLDLDYATEIVIETAKQGIKPVVSFMIGFPDEDLDDIEKTLKLIIKLICYGAWPQMTMLSLLPGTEMYKDHKDQLIFDGVFSGFSNSYLNEKELKLVKDHPGLFSSFYSLPNENFSREQMDLLAKMVNLLPDFIPTLRLLKKKILTDLGNIEISKYIDKNIIPYIENPEIVAPEFFFVTEIIKNYIASLEDNAIDRSIWDVFWVDCIKAFLRIKFHLDKMLEVDNGRTRNEQMNKKIMDRYIWNRYQEVIELEYNLLPTLYNDFNLNEEKGLEKELNYYLITNIDGERSKVNKISFEEYSIILQINHEKKNLKKLKISMDVINRFIKYGSFQIIYN